MKPVWEMLHPGLAPEDLGLLPFMLDTDDPRPANKQFNQHYIGGWHPLKGHKLTKNNVLLYPRRPLAPRRPPAEAARSNETSQ
jgi:hypothetical protein